MVEPLIELLAQYEKITKDLNDSIDEATKTNFLLAIAKAEVAKNRHKKELVEEQIRCQKQFIKQGG